MSVVLVSKPTILNYLLYYYHYYYYRDTVILAKKFQNTFHPDPFF